MVQTLFKLVVVEEEEEVTTHQLLPVVPVVPVVVQLVRLAAHQAVRLVAVLARQVLVELEGTAQKTMAMPVVWSLVVMAPMVRRMTLELMVQKLMAVAMVVVLVVMVTRTTVASVLAAVAAQVVMAAAAVHRQLQATLAAAVVVVVQVTPQVHLPQRLEAQVLCQEMIPTATELELAMVELAD